MEKRIITIEITKEDLNDIETELEIITAQLNAGFTSGHDRNQDLEDYSYSVTTVTL